MNALHLPTARPRESGDPGATKQVWMPAFAGMSGEVRKWTR